MSNEVEIISGDFTDIAPRQQDTGLLDTNTDNILYLAENPDAWHRTLKLVTSCDGIAFYEAE